MFYRKDRFAPHKAYGWAVMHRKYQMNSGSIVSKTACKASAFIGMLLLSSAGSFSGAAAAVFAGPVSFSQSSYAGTNSLAVSFRPALPIAELALSGAVYKNVKLTGGNLRFYFDVIDNLETVSTSTNYGYSTQYNTFGITRVSAYSDQERSSAYIRSLASDKTYSGRQSYSESTTHFSEPRDYYITGGFINHSFIDTTDTIQGYLGSFSVIVPLSEADLNVFNTGNPGTFDLTLSGANVTLRSVVARVTYDLDNPSPTFQAPPAAIPEPSTWALLTVGFGGLGAMLRRRGPALSPQA